MVNLERTIAWENKKLPIAGTNGRLRGSFVSILQQVSLHK